MKWFDESDSSIEMKDTQVDASQVYRNTNKKYTENKESEIFTSENNNEGKLF